MIPNDSKTPSSMQKTRKENYFRFTGALSDVGRGLLAGYGKIEFFEIGRLTWLLLIIFVIYPIIAYQVF